MTYAATSIVTWGIYALCTGVAMLFQPNTVLQLLGLEPTFEHWILIVAIMLMGFGFYYIVLGATEVKQFFIVSAVGRTLFFMITTGLILLDKAPIGVLIFGVVDLLTAIWTAVALHFDKKAMLLAT